jgi:RNA polymerase sigma factor (sigma-70 family)
MFVEKIEQGAIEKRVTSRAMTIEEIIDDHFEDVYRFASRRLKREDAEDATLETFKAAIDHLQRLRGSEPLLWLLGIARRKVANHQRNLFRRKEESLRGDIPSVDGQTIASKEAGAQLRRIVEGLPNDQREALLLQHLEGLSVSQIAVVMHRSEPAVTGLLYRARQAAYERGKSYFVDSEVNP